tara:strand:+ start:186 stop:581 length:396 start_codon:yes stop_codon:yes gene_type:complete
MFRFIRNKAPFILLFLNIVICLWHNFELYIIYDGSYEFFKLAKDSYFKHYSYYFGDLIGYSIFTNLFMLSVYLNKKYCDATKICVLGLIALNMYSLISHGFNFYSEIYDLYLMAAIICVIGTYKIQNKNKK